MQNLRGSMFMILAMFAFTVEDFTLKIATQFIPLGELLLLCGIIGSVFFMFCSKIKKEPILHRDAFSKILIIRSIFETMGRVFYALAIMYIPITNAASIHQVTPIVVVLGAVYFLKEEVSWERWIAIFTGFIGVLIIIQPGTNDFSIFSLFAVLGVIGFAGRDLATRMSPTDISNYQLGSFGFLMVILAGLLLIIFNSIFMPSSKIWFELNSVAWLFILANAIAGICAYFCLTIAMRVGDVSFVTPFRYIRVLFALLFGVLLLGEEPNSLVLVGSMIVLVSGIYIVVKK